MPNPKLVITIALLAIAALAADPASWYYSASGNLDTDKYYLYPYEKTSLQLGYSIFGELINGTIGLKYDTVDPFAPASTPKELWYQGWFIYISYNHPDAGPRAIWATAQFADLRNYESLIAGAYGNRWIRAPTAYEAGLPYDDNPNSATFGSVTSGDLLRSGRKTNAIVAPPTDVPQFQILYDGPRRHIARIVWDIYDYVLLGPDYVPTPLARVTTIIDFDKTTKTVLVIREVKSLSDVPITIWFSERGAVRLGPADSQYTIFQQNAHFTTNAPQSVFGNIHVLQSVNTATGKVFFAAFYPTADYRTANGWASRGARLLATADNNVPGAYPYYIAEWQRVLNPGQSERFVILYGVVDSHGVDDTNYGTTFDPEAKYLVERRFAPFDLPSIDDVLTRYMVRFHATPTIVYVGGQKDIAAVVITPDDLQSDNLVMFVNELPASRDRIRVYLINEYGQKIVTTDDTLVNLRVLRGNQLLQEGIDYEIGNDVTYVYVDILEDAIADADYTIYFSVDGVNGYNWVVTGRQARALASAGASLVAEALYDIGVPVWWGGVDMFDTFGPGVPYVFRSFVGPAAGPVRNYFYSPPSDNRSAFVFGWGGRAVASSAMIFIGGPRPNRGAEYFNEFAPVVLVKWNTAPMAPDAAYSGTVVGPTGQFHWNTAPGLVDKFVLADGSLIDPANNRGVVFVAEDVNGTRGLVIYGYQGNVTWALAYSFFMPVDIVDGVAIIHGTLLNYLTSLGDGTTGVVIDVEWVQQYGFAHPRLTIVGKLTSIG